MYFKLVKKLVAVFMICVVLKTAGAIKVSDCISTIDAVLKHLVPLSTGVLIDVEPFGNAGKVRASLNKSEGKAVDAIIQNIDKQHILILQALHFNNLQIVSLSDVTAFYRHHDTIGEKEVDKFIDKMRQFLDKSMFIESLFVEFTRYYDEEGDYRRDVKDYAKAVLTHTEDSPSSTLENMLNLLTSNDGLYYLINLEEVENYIVSNRNKAGLQVMHTLHAYFSICEMRSLVITAYVISWLARNGKHWRTVQMIEYCDLMTKRLELSLTTVKIYSAYSSGRYWVADNDKIRTGGYNYFSFVNFMRGHIDRSFDCEDLSSRSKKRNFCKLESEEIQRSKCTGSLHNCVEKDNSTINICHSKNTKIRKYEFVSFASEKPADNCTGEERIYANQSECFNCLCVCDEPVTAYTERYISLDEMVTHFYTTRRVVTGMRFNQHNNVITLDIQQSELDEYGRVIPNTSSWVINKGRDIFALSLSKRTIHLGQIQAENVDNVIIGLRFEVVKDGVQLNAKVAKLTIANQEGTTLLRTKRSADPFENATDSSDVPVSYNGVTTIGETSVYGNELISASEPPAGNFSMIREPESKGDDSHSNVTNDNTDGSLRMAKVDLPNVEPITTTTQQETTVTNAPHDADDTQRTPITESIGERHSATTAITTTAFESLDYDIKEQKGTWIKSSLMGEVLIQLNDELELPDNEHVLYIKSFGNHRVLVTHSGFETDMGQTPLPFFDGYPVVMNPPLPLRGIGLVYKSAGAKYGGYIAPFLVVVDLSVKTTSNDIRLRAASLMGSSKGSNFGFELILLLMTSFLMIIKSF